LTITEYVLDTLFFNSLSHLKSCEVTTITISSLQMRKLKLKRVSLEVKSMCSVVMLPPDLAPSLSSCMTGKVNPLLRLNFSISEG
jgi:hypothetical protein